MRLEQTLLAKLEIPLIEKAMLCFNNHILVALNIPSINTETSVQ